MVWLNSQGWPINRGAEHAILLILSRSVNVKRRWGTWIKWALWEKQLKKFVFHKDLYGNPLYLLNIFIPILQHRVLEMSRTRWWKYCCLNPSFAWYSPWSPQDWWGGELLHPTKWDSLLKWERMTFLTVRLLNTPRCCFKHISRTDMKLFGWLTETMNSG